MFTPRVKDSIPICEIYFQISMVLLIFVPNVLNKAKSCRCLVHVIGSHFQPWCTRWHGFFFVFHIHVSVFHACWGTQFFYLARGNVICQHQLVHFSTICKDMQFVWVVLYVIIFFWPFLF